ncbi:MAG: WXG100 family type VII secretion target [Gemmiger formicilis]|uniref:WXG100 family type VII secretion target n=1 Tax=Gemmiger formicilis TaxID=745368 RepID=UPI003FEF6FE4|nr:WXG100 family type VII secretion target [Gemmiger formicilis]
MNVSDVNFTVTPEVLQQKSQQIAAEVNKLRGLFSNVQQAVNGTAAYWQGEAGTAHRDAYNSHNEEFNTMLARLQEHVTDLNSIAGNYITFENQIKEIEDALPSDVIV